MDIHEIAERCIGYWEAREWFEAFEKLYSNDAVNVEPTNWHDRASVVAGKEAIIEKYRWVTEQLLIEHSIKCSEPYFFGGDRFIVSMENEVTPRQTGKRIRFTEVGLYTVKDGRVIKEEFFYSRKQMDMFGHLNELAAESGR
jgi:ketosteroid isomerase-like protein